MEYINQEFTTGSVYFYIAADGKFYRVPKPKGAMFKAIPGLANQDVLMVSMVYSILNRLPVKILNINFDRVDLDGEGRYVIDDEELFRKLRNVRVFGGGVLGPLAFENGVVEIPDSPVIPSAIEKKGIIAFLKEKYPRLHKTSPYAIEDKIKSLKYKHNELLADVKRASKKMDKFTGDDQGDPDCPF